jgi:hypothetical protein
MKRCRVAIEQTKRTSVEVEVADDADDEDIKATALEEAELAEWDEDPAEVVSIAIVDHSPQEDVCFGTSMRKQGHDQYWW